MFQPRITGAIIALGLAAPLCTDLQAQTKSYPLSGSRVAVYNLAGKLSVEAGSGSTTTVEVSQLGSDAGKLSVVTGERGNRQALRVVYPSDRIVYPVLGRHSESDVQVDDDGFFDSDRGGRGHRVEITGSGSGLEAHADIKVKLASGTSVDVHLACGDVTVTDVNGDIMVSTGSGDVDASGVKGDLDIDTGSGNVTAEKVSGPLKIDTGSGDVKIRGQNGGSLKIDTGSGNITADDATADHIKMDTGSGDIELNGATAPDASFDTGSGNVTAHFSGKLDRVSVETGSGDVNVTIPADFSGTLDLESSNDDGIDIGFPVQLVRKDEGELRAKVGTGSGEIRVETGSGSVKIDRK